MDHRGAPGRGNEEPASEQITVLAEPFALRSIFLRRLKRALLLRFYTEALLSPSDRRLLDRVIYSSYCDCQEIDAAAEARGLLDAARAGVGLFKRPATRAGGERGWST